MELRTIRSKQRGMGTFQANKPTTRSRLYSFQH
ncbi:uncharacterized protein METZ01_LOCUS478256 [marine metagenome]|uniref:Uncharacterized protein n=1 Tax=marine metagenome TaxID=408172 RepID=A0A383BZR3_9ZZZZ